MSRPECVIAHQSGLLIVPSWSLSGGISVISPTGDTHHIDSKYTVPLRPNGIALSTRKTPRASDYRFGANTGFIAVIDPNSNDARIVADGLGYTNECVVDEKRGELWVNETFGRRLTRFRLKDFESPQVSLTHPKTICNFGAGTYPDGLAMDDTGQMWITSIVSNRILRISREGLVNVMFEDSDPAHLQWTEEAFLNNSLDREHLDKAKGKCMQDISNLAFGGPSRSSLYVGNLLGDSLPCFATDFCGTAMPHWSVPLGEHEHFL